MSRNRGGLDHCLVALLATISVSLRAPPARAQEAPHPVAAPAESALSEVIVTATRREEALSKVPVSLSVLTQDNMDEKGIKDITDVARFTPGVAIGTGQSGGGAGNANSISIRGISSGAGSGTTGIYIDDVPIQMRALGFNADDALPKIFDLDRVEVLRGPQGTLFGAGSEGGTVRYITSQPSLRKSSVYARAETSFTQDGSINYEAGLAGGGPLIEDRLGFRASAWYRRDGGWIDRVDPTTLTLVEPNANHEETYVLRVAGLWQPVDGVRVSPSVLYQSSRSGDVDYYWPSLSAPSQNRFISANPTDAERPDSYYLPAINLEVDLGASRLVSTTSYFHRDDVSGYDGTLYNLGYYQTPAFWTNGPPAGFPFLDGSGVHLPAGLTDYRAPATVLNEQRYFTQEVRLQSVDPKARLIWTAGAFLSINRQLSLEQIHDPQADLFFEQVYGETIAAAFSAQGAYGSPPVPTNPDGSSYLPNGDSYAHQLIGHDRQIAGFGELEIGLTNTLKLTAGVRVAKTRFSVQTLSNGPQDGGLRVGGSGQGETPVTPKLGLSWQVDPNNLYYATYAKGFRMGGGNAPVPASLCATDFAQFGITQAPASYKSDTVQSFEVGAKNTLGSRLKLSSSVYYIRWNNIQQGVVPPICGIQWTDNLGAAVSKGFDLQAELALSRGLSLETTLGYTDARYSKDAFPGGVPEEGVLPIVAKGDAIAGASAPWTASAGLEYSFDAFAHVSFIRLDYQYASGEKWLQANRDPRTSQYDNEIHTAAPFTYPLSSTHFMSLRTGSSLGSLSLSLFVDNLFNTHTTTSFNHQTIPYDPNTGTALASPMYRNLTFRPRTAGLTAIYRY